MRVQDLEWGYDWAQHRMWSHPAVLSTPGTGSHRGDLQEPRDLSERDDVWEGRYKKGLFVFCCVILCLLFSFLCSFDVSFVMFGCSACYVFVLLLYLCAWMCLFFFVSLPFRFFLVTVFCSFVDCYFDLDGRLGRGLGFGVFVVGSVFLYPPELFVDKFGLAVDLHHVLMWGMCGGCCFRWVWGNKCAVCWYFLIAVVV